MTSTHEDALLGYVGDEVLLTSRKVLLRYGISDRTLDSWCLLKRKGESDFPSPIMINKRRYFKLQELQAWERQRATRAS
jgi:predicted DNA-binding transcriptional regulator AlpA